MPLRITSEQAVAMNEAKKRRREERATLAAELAAMALGRPLAEQTILFRAAAEAITFPMHADPAVPPTAIEVASWD